MSMTSKLLRYAEPRFWAKVKKTADCWLWTGAKSHLGYGHFAADASRATPKTYLAHRYSYELLVGPIPEGLELDHLCRNPSCVNPDHLEAVTSSENNLRSPLIALGNNGYGRRTHCKNGHEFTPENTESRGPGQGRACLTCRRARGRKYWTKRSET